MAFNVLICLIILISQCVHCKVININSDNGTISTECCVHGACVCSSLYTALANITSNTVINITSKSVALNNTTTMGSGNLTNIAITGSNVTIMCNNSGSVYCESCDNVTIEGITWDSCGDPNGAHAGVTFNGTSNISLVNCTFQHSQISAVSLIDVSDNISIQYCKFLSNLVNVPTQVAKDNEFDGVLRITRSPLRLLNNSNITVSIVKCYFYDNGFFHSSPNSLSIHIIDSPDSLINRGCVILKSTTFISNRVGAYISVHMEKLVSVQLIEILAFNNTVHYELDNRIGTGIITIYATSNNDDVNLSIISSHFISNIGVNVWCTISAASVTIKNSSFIDGKLNASSSVAILTIVIIVQASKISEISFHTMQVSYNMINASKFVYYNSLAGPGAVSIVSDYDIVINMSMVNFTSNQYSGGDGGALFISFSSYGSSILLNKCKFVNNSSPGHGAALYVDTQDSSYTQIVIIDTSFDHNNGDRSVVYIAQGGFSSTNNIDVQLNASAFTNSVGSSLYLSACDVYLSETSTFKNNTAENGGAMYMDQGTTVTMNSASVEFISNTARLNGGAIYVNFLCSDLDAINIFSISNFVMCRFINNTATFAGNSLYFNVPRFCSINTNINDSHSILHVPCQFNYSQPVNGTMMQHIPCDLDYTLFNGTGAPIVTSPHELKLYFPYNEGYSISNSSNPNTYFIMNNILGQEVKFTGVVFDYFGKPTEPILFNTLFQCSNMSRCSAFTLIGGNQNHILTQSIDNFTVLNVKFKGKKINSEYINLTLSLTSLSYSLEKIVAILKVELVPCIEHPGYAYDVDSQTCICYDADVKCSTDGNELEIKRGYWFGSIASKATTSLCPNRYCKFTNHKQTSEGYFELPNTINAQCNHHRVGRACGECSSGYTLSYDSTDCISVHQCGAGWTVLVIVLTCLYWIAIVVGVFICFSFQISLGHLYGIIYYYSIVGILLANNPYISDDAFQFVSILSSFAQLTPQFLGKFCFVKGLSGIDQLFIHYSHPVAVSSLLLLIVVVTRFSARVTLFVRRRIIRVICLLILLAYTSIASTSLQLLQPLRFTDVKEWYSYSSPHIQYFHGRHAVYGVMAVICEIVVIGLSLLLLLEPVLSRKINFIRIKPLLDQFQGCYKDKYRCFTAYYLICRQVIFLILYSFNSNYYNMLFYLQTICVIIALIHIWFQPYHNELMNALDGVMLLTLVLIVNINTFPFLQIATTEISLIFVIFPLFMYCTTAVNRIVYAYFKKKCSKVVFSHAAWYSEINNADIDEDDNDGLHEAIR